MPKGHLKEILSGPVEIKAKLNYPIGVNQRMGDKEKPFVTLCQVVYLRGMLQLVIPANYKFDGASIPRFLWWLKGFSPLDRSILAALVHDFCCDHPAVLDRVVADAIFYAMLRHAGVGMVRAWLMWKAVRAWSTWRAVQARFKRRKHDSGSRVHIDKS